MPQGRLSDDVWAVVQDTMRRFKGWELNDSHRQLVEAQCEVIPFDGGAFVIRGCEVDLFVTPEKRGRWATRSLLDRVFGGLIRTHGKATCSVHPDNGVCLRFVRRLGFVEVSRTEQSVRLEMTQWK